MAKELQVVLIDDDVAICQSLQILLQDVAQLNYFHDVASAKDYLATHYDDVDLLILDYQISSDNGITFYKNEIQTQETPIPAVLISGFIVTKLKSKEELDNLNNLFLKVFEKPFDFIQLREFIVSHFNITP